MPAYLVQAPVSTGRCLVGAADAMVIVAADAATAKDMAAAQYPADSNALWQAATVTDLSTGAADYLGFTFCIQMTGQPKVRVAALAAENMDTWMARVATAVAAAWGTTATYTAAGNILQVASAGNNLGDKTVVAEMYPSTSETKIAAFVGTITHQGSAGAALTVVLNEPSPIPKTVAPVKLA